MSAGPTDIRAMFSDEAHLQAALDAFLEELDSPEARYRAREAAQLELADREGASHLRAKDGTPAGDFGGGA